MRRGYLLRTGLVIAISALLCTEALAENCGGRWTNVAQSAETIEIGKDHKLTTFMSRGSSTSDNSPFVGVGSCAGYVLTTPDGKSRMAYACARKNKEGDAWSYSGVLEPGADRGTWTNIGGTGIYAGKVGSSGWWQSAVADGKATTGTWGGDCK